MSREKKKDPWLPHRLDALLRIQAAEARIETAAQAMLADWLPAAHAAVLDPWHALTAAAGDPNSPPDPDNITRADDALDAAYAAKLAPVLEDVFGERFAAVCRDAAISDIRYREAYAAKTSLRIKRISHTTREEIRDLVHEAIGKGLSMQAVAKGVDAALTLDGPAPRFTMFAEAAREETDQAVRRLRTLMAVPMEDRDARWRAQLDEVRSLRDRARQDRSTAAESAAKPRAKRALTIARTEVMAALNGGTLAGMRARSDAFGQPMEKQWLATADARTRETHRAADGQRVSLAAPFDVGGAQLDHPGDPDGPADEVINCRCCMLEAKPGEDPLNPLGGGKTLTPPPEPIPLPIEDRVAASKSLARFSEADLFAALAPLAESHPEQVDRLLAELDARQEAEELARKAEATKARARAQRDAKAAARAEEQSAEFDRLIQSGVDAETATEDVYGVSIAQQRRDTVTAELRANGYSGTRFDDLARQAWRDEQDQRYFAAEDATRGAVLNELGRRMGVDPRSLFVGEGMRAKKYASEELLAWWDENGRVTFADYKARLLGDRVAVQREDFLQ